jgi:hypothetical protein
MATQPSDRTTSGPPLAGAPARGRESPTGDFMVRHPTLAAVLWTVGVACGGAVFVLLFFATFGVVSFYRQPGLGIATLVMTIVFALAMWSYARSERMRHMRARDRERRGF